MCVVHHLIESYHAYDMNKLLLIEENWKLASIRHTWIDFASETNKPRNKLALDSHIFIGMHGIFLAFVTSSLHQRGRVRVSAYMNKTSMNYGKCNKSQSLETQSRMQTHTHTRHTNMRWSHSDSDDQPIWIRHKDHWIFQTNFCIWHELFRLIFHHNFVRLFMYARVASSISSCCASANLHIAVAEIFHGFMALSKFVEFFFHPHPV